MQSRLWLCGWLGAALLGCTGEVGPGDDGGSGASASTFIPAEVTMHRLTSVQIDQTHLALLGEPLSRTLALPTDDLLYGFTSIAAAGQTISSLDAEKYEAVTYEALEQVWADPARRDALVGCAPVSFAEPCVRAFLEDFTMKAWRRPVEAQEIELLLSLGNGIFADLGDAPRALQFVLASVLQSPHFLFRVEVGEPDPENGERLRFTSWEMASRLSYLLWNAPPDAELLTVAQSDSLQDAEVVRAQATRMLQDPRARAALVGFYRDFLNLAKLDQLDKDPDRFPMFSATLGPSMRIELERLFEGIVFEKRVDFRQVLTTRETYINEDLAKVYGIEGISGPEFRPYVFAEGAPRSGMLTSAGFLAGNAYKTQTSPTHRGRFIRINLLCGDVPPPPAGIDTTLPDPDPNTPLTLRERLDEHRTNAECAGCHSLMDPLGFPFEAFDAVGQYRQVDELGLSVDTSATIEKIAVSGPIDAAAAIAGMPEVAACIARRFYEHAGGHVAYPGEERAIERLVADFAKGDFDFQDLVIDLVANDGYRYAIKGEQ